MKTIKDETTIIISRVTSKFVRKIDVFEDAKEKRCKGYIKKTEMTPNYINYDVIILSELKNNSKKTSLNC